MTRIDFHTNVADRIAYTCRLVRKARLQAADSRIVILAQDKRQLSALDQALWTFSAQEFLPHAEAGDPLAAQSPVILTDSDGDELPHHDMLINLSGATPTHFAQFARMFEIVSTDAADIEEGRKRYAHYRQRGYSLTHNVAKS